MPYKNPEDKKANRKSPANLAYIADLKIRRRALTLERRTAFERICVVCRNPIPVERDMRAVSCSLKCTHRRANRRYEEKLKVSTEMREHKNALARKRHADREAVWNAAKQLGLIGGTT